jgi:hypothetical protein
VLLSGEPWAGTTRVVTVIGAGEVVFPIRGR